MSKKITDNFTILGVEPKKRTVFYSPLILFYLSAKLKSYAYCEKK